MILPTKPRMPRHKGRVERGIDYVKNALKGRTFASLAAQNGFLADWERNVADTRIHGTTRRHVGQHFLEVEKPALKPLPASLFPSFTEGKRSVHTDGHVEFEKAYYSVPPEYTNREVWVRGESRLIRIFSLKMEPITVHCRAEPGTAQTADEPYPSAQTPDRRPRRPLLLERCQEHRPVRRGLGAGRASSPADRVDPGDAGTDLPRQEDAGGGARPGGVQGACSGPVGGWATSGMRWASPRMSSRSTSWKPIR